MLLVSELPGLLASFDLLFVVLFPDDVLLMSTVGSSGKETMR